MKIGLALPHYDFSFPDGGPLSWERLAEWAVRAEDLGFDSVWISDHFFLSLARYGGPDEPFGSAEPLTTLAALAVRTERVRLGTLVLGTGFRHPALVAKSASTVDLLSGGRLDLGVGAGWYEDEYRAMGYAFPATGERFEILEETLQVLALLFADGPANWEGAHFRLQDAYNNPPAVQKPRPPLWVGGKGGPRMARLAARYADGWNTVWTWTPETYEERLKVVLDACLREDRDPDTLRRSVGLYALVGEDDRDLVARYRALQRWTPGGALDGELLEEWGRDKLVGTPERVVERLASFAALGVEEVILSASSLPFAIHDASMLEVVSQAVIPPAREL